MGRDCVRRTRRWRRSRPRTSRRDIEVGVGEAAVSPLGRAQLRARSPFQYLPRTDADMLGARSRELGTSFAGCASYARHVPTAGGEQNGAIHTKLVLGSCTLVLRRAISPRLPRLPTQLRPDAYRLTFLYISSLSPPALFLCPESFAGSREPRQPVSRAPRILRHLAGRTAWPPAGHISPSAPPPTPAHLTTQLVQSSTSKGTTPELRTYKPQDTSPLRPGDSAWLDSGLNLVACRYPRHPRPPENI